MADSPHSISSSASIDGDLLATSDHSGDTVEPAWVSERASVRAEIMAIIKPYRLSEDEPPFSLPELVVMAILCSEEYSLERMYIRRWIKETFPYYAKPILNAFITRLFPQMYEHYEEKALPGFQMAFRTAFQQYEVPLRSDETTPGDMEEGIKYTVELAAGRIYLSRWLERERNGIFPFLKLAPELRNIIYKMVFTYPPGGLTVQYTTIDRESRRSMQVCALERIDGKTEPPGQTWGEQHPEDRDVTDIRITSMGSALGLLSTSKQVHAEAAPLFYNLNPFYFAGIIPLNHVLADPINASRMRHLREVRFDLDLCKNSGYNFPAIKVFIPAMKALSSLPALRRLTVTLLNCRFLEIKTSARRELGGRVKKYTRISQIPGFNDLAVAASKAQEVVFEEDYEGLVEEYVKEEVAKIRAKEAAAKKAPRKKRIGNRIKSERRVVEDSDEEDEGVGKVVKMGKKSVKS
ncbi:hypothetical protein B0A50_07328 [Salinomyces thailandicus]|uniref:Fork-head domain-containing protein n=1 Tax=Salinomyces thailandicus TaxID=706561 RepID=A0A4U0TMR2_9PEZI|nr:hypothetical protein B0A50_07328 [Salinomyces thailandica]